MIFSSSLPFLNLSFQTLFPLVFGKARTSMLATVSFIGKERKFKTRSDDSFKRDLNLDGSLHWCFSF